MSEDIKERIALEFALENLAISVFDYANSDLSDQELVDHAAKKINMLKAMILAAGVSPAMLKACMEN